MKNSTTACGIVLSLFLAACGGHYDNAASRQASATMTMTQEADRKVGMPRITNFFEREFAKQVYEDRDRAITTYTYLQGLDGKLHCLGATIGYGIPYGVQFTAPEYPQFARASRADGSPSVASEYLLSQPEPNGLYMPDSASATWVRLQGPDGRATPVMVEPNVTVSSFELAGGIVATPCPQSKRQSQ